MGIMDDKNAAKLAVKQWWESASEKVREAGRDQARLRVETTEAANEYRRAVDELDAIGKAIVLLDTIEKINEGKS